MSFFLGTQRTSLRFARLLIAVVGIFLLFQFVSLYLSWPKQAAVGTICILIAITLNRRSTSVVTSISLVFLSLAATLRYGWWRVYMLQQFFRDESNNRFTIDSVLMLILLSAEIYTIMIMVLGFMQTIFPLHRKPVELPPEESLWPDVDVLIPTYNEPLSLVRYTALAANNIDYPPNKLHVYVLDDGTRPEFRTFCQEAGVGYIVRKEHQHAKAGNINHALTKMHSPLVTIFDCDHVPTRSFLQVTVGWFLADQKLAMLQTPHYFYSPDPFERNLLRYQSIPNEGELFYGIIQDGNDLWNATFFCGSCAVIRRKALDEVGGIATETVTEDAHTSLRMQKKGWDTAYINLRQAAGLATETLSAHVGQRIRWARGMIQILRIENPLLASGMKLSQRLCYFNAMMHFLYAVPRLVFLCAPLVYMLLGRVIIPGYWVAILSYALPHLFLSGLVNSRLQSKHRHSFWNEIYETVLAPYILLPTILALINPKLGKFNVTDKGNTLAETTFDRRIASPTAWLLFANFIGVCMAPYRFLVTDPTHPGTVISNLLWILFNMVILGVAAAVANEQKQRRASVRIPAQLHLVLHLSDGTVVRATSLDMSVGGAAVRLEPGARDFEMGETFRISFPEQTGQAQIGAAIVGKYGDNIRLQFQASSIAEQETLTCALYSRADSWVNVRESVEEDRPLISFLRVVRLSFSGFYQVLKAPFQGKKGAVVEILLFALLLAHPLKAQIPGAQPVDAQPATSDSISSPNSLSPASAVVPRASANRAAPSALEVQGIHLQVPQSPAVNFGDANEKISLADMGVHASIPMHGPRSFYTAGFVLPYTRIPKHASLYLSYRFSSNLLPEAASIKIELNGAPIAEISDLDQEPKSDAYSFAILPLPAELLVRKNELTFEFNGGALLQREDQAKSSELANIGATSTVVLECDSLPFKNDLGLLPLPIFDPDLQTTTTIPFVFLKPPSARTLQAASIVASWFGIQATSAPVHFKTSIGSIPAGNVVLLGHPADFPPEMQIPTGGPSLSIKVNPSDPDGSALVLAGDDDNQLLDVARSLSLMAVTHIGAESAPATLGESVFIGNFPLPEPRKVDDAPRWLSTDRLTSLWSLSSRDALRSDGSKPLPIYYRVPPDIYYGEKQNVSLNLRYRYDARLLAPGSAMRVYNNGTLINEVPLPPGPDYVDGHRAALMPVADIRPFSNTMTVSFDFKPLDGNAMAQQQALFGSVLQDSYLDLRDLDHWVQMPDLELFANAGFPFTRKADLSETVFVLPHQPDEQEITLLLTLMGHFGAQTGYPALRVEIAGPEAVIRGDRDYVMLGNVSDQPAFSFLESFLTATLDDQGIHVKPRRNYGFSSPAWWRRLSGASLDERIPSNTAGIPDLLIEGIESPYYKNRSIVTLMLRGSSAADDFADVFLKRSQSSDIHGSVSLLRNGKFSSYDLDTPIYHVGNISHYTLMRIILTEHFWLLLFAVTIFSMVMARFTRDYLVLVAAQRLKLSDPPQENQPIAS